MQAFITCTVIIHNLNSHNYYTFVAICLVSAPGYENKSLTINVKTNQNQKINVVMDSIGLAINYHNYDQMVTILTNLSNEYPDITSLERYFLLLETHCL